MFTVLSLRLIRHYQRRGGSKQLLGIECNFEPTCSEYTRLCIIKYGAVKGWKLGIQRICRCNNRDAVTKVYDDVP